MKSRVGGDEVSPCKGGLALRGVGDGGDTRMASVQAWERKAYDM